MAPLLYSVALLVAVNVAAWLVIRDANAKRPAVAHNMPQSRKHVRTCICSGSFRIAYYGHNGRKVTAREFPMSQYRAVISSARAKGYRVI